MCDSTVPALHWAAPRLSARGLPVLEAPIKGCGVPRTTALRMPRLPQTLWASADGCCGLSCLDAPGWPAPQGPVRSLAAGPASFQAVAFLPAAWLVSLLTFRWIFLEVVPGAHASRPPSPPPPPPPQAVPIGLHVLLCASHRAPEGWLACTATWAFLVALLPHRVTGVAGSTGSYPRAGTVQATPH